MPTPDYMPYRFSDHPSEDEGHVCAADAAIMSLMLQGFRAWIAFCRELSRLMHHNGALTRSALDQVELSYQDDLLPVWSLMDDQIKREGRE